MKKPKSISILIPTLNASRVLENCLESIKQQVYPKKLVEILIADGGSNDKTLLIAQKYGAKIYFNNLKTGESGKATALKYAGNDLIALIDSDNYLNDPDWLKQMTSPFKDEDILGSEPWEFICSSNDNLINKYCALMGMGDPYCFFTGNYDHLNSITNQWTGLIIEEQDYDHYLKIKLKKGEMLPTIGANGTVWRTKVIKNIVGSSRYLFDTDIPYLLSRKSDFCFAKVKIGIVHDYCRSLSDFVRKQRRRAKDFYYLEKKGERKATFQRQLNHQLIFILSTVTIIPLIIQMIIGFYRRPNYAWLIHPIACLITLYIYGTETIMALFKRKGMSREKWKQ